VIAFAPMLDTLTTGVGAAMILIGLRRGLLQPRKAPRRCRSCGRLTDRPACTHCTGNTR
jgi:recombinational DNA repair protein RecR